MSVWSDVPSYMQTPTFPMATARAADPSGAAAAGWVNSWGNVWTNSQKPGQYLSTENVNALVNSQKSANALINPATFNPNINYEASVAPYLSKIDSAANTQGASGVSGFDPYEVKLRQLLENPDSIADTGAYKFNFNEGQRAVERSAAARGMSGSGNVLAELTKYGYGLASQEYGKEADRLGSLSGMQKNYLLGLKSAANQEVANKSTALLGAGNLLLNAKKASGADTLDAAKIASNNLNPTRAFSSPYIW